MMRISRVLAPIVCVVIVFAIFIGLIVKEGELKNNKTEIDSYTEEFEISQLAYAEEQFTETFSNPVYRAGLRNKNTAVTIKITSEEFARYVVGERVTVNVTVYEHVDGNQSTEYKIIELVDNEGD